ncbi:hypothetical protein PENTCL1PPCAC_17091, partial [Pristionchus entomophagus]
GALLWVPPMQAIIFSATFWGSLITVVTTGRVIQRFGAKSVLAVSSAVSIAVTVSTPSLSELSFVSLFAVRVLMGAAESFIVPSIGATAVRWIPPSERFVMMDMITSGNQLAASFSAVVTAALCLSPIGWPLVYYFYATIATVWLLAWIVLAANSPSESSLISESEADFLAKTIQAKPQNPERIPWRTMLTSKPFYACLCCQFAYIYTGTIMQGFLPTFIRDELLQPLSMNGLITLIPFGTMLIMKTLFGILARRLNESKLSTPTTRTECFQLICSIGCILSMLSLGFLSSPDRLWISLLSLTIFGISFAAGIPGFAVSTQSLSPQHGAIITQISAVVAVLAGICAPMVMWFIMTLKVNGVVDSIWKVAFTVACSLNLLAIVAFLIFGKGENSWLIEIFDVFQLATKHGDVMRNREEREFTRAIKSRNLN